MGSSLDSSATGDSFDRGTIHVVLVTILSLGRMWMDIFILAVNCRDWMNKKCLTLTDRILTLQGSNRICFGCIAIIWYSLAKIYPWIAKFDLIYKVFMFILWNFIVWNLWLTAFLCTYFCVKIANFSHPFFIHLKLRLSGLVSTWLLASLVLSLASCLPYACSDVVEIRGNQNISNFINQTTIASHVFVLLGLGCFAALSICATSALLLLFSLWRHHRRMLGSLDGHRSPQTKAHFQAVTIILSLLVNNVVAFLSILLMLLTDFAGKPIPNLVSVAILNSCISLESLISIWGNTKLKNELYRALYFAKCSGNAS